jgi:serine/threonine protein kinase
MATGTSPEMGAKAHNAQALLGQWLTGGYRIERFIGSGAFAWVYYARTQRGEPCAVKILQNATEEARTLFAREIKVLRQLPSNPYCVAYMGDGLAPDGSPFLVMEYIDGATLKDAFKFKPEWAVEEAIYMMLQMCDALAGLHRLGVAHRDLKPENVMVTRDWQVKLMDFGLVKDAQGLLKLFETEDILTGRDFAENIDKAMLAGTPEYMAPEQFSDPMVEDEALAKTDTWSDVYSLGLIFFQLLTGQKLFPFKPASGDSAAYARALLAYIKTRTTFQDQQLRRPESVPAKLWPILQVALKQHPKQRYHNATDMGDALRRYSETGETDEFRDDEHTSMADMSSLLSGLNSHYGTGFEASEKTSVIDSVEEVDEATTFASSSMVRPTPAAGRPPGAPPVIRSQPPPPIDVGAVQRYREQRLNQPGMPDVTLPPGMRTSDVFPNGLPQQNPGYPQAVPTPYAGMPSGQYAAPAPAPVAAPPAPAKSGSSWIIIVLLLVIALGAGGAAAAYVLMRP